MLAKLCPKTSESWLKFLPIALRIKVTPKAALKLPKVLHKKVFFTSDTLFDSGIQDQIKVYH